MNYLSKRYFWQSVAIIFLARLIICHGQDGDIISDAQTDQQREQQIIFEIDGVNSAINNPCSGSDDSPSNKANLYGNDDDGLDDEPDDQDQDIDEQYGNRELDNDVDDTIDDDQVQLVPDPALVPSSLNQEIDQQTVDEQYMQAQDQQPAHQASSQDDDRLPVQPLQHQSVAPMPAVSVDNKDEPIATKPSAPAISVPTESREETANTCQKYDAQAYDVMDYIKYGVVKIRDSIKALFK
jgi:hypothetical protein